MLRMIAPAALLAALVTCCFAASASAIVPTATLNQGAGTTAGTSPALGIDVDLHPLGAGDSAKDISIALPPGMMVNLQTAGGVCLASKTPIPACRIGSGTVNGPGGAPVALYLVAPLLPTDIAGIALTDEGEPTTTGDLALETAPEVGEVMALRLLPPGIGELALTLEGQRLPTTCNSRQKIAIAAASWAGSQGSVTVPLTVTGCSALPYAPTMTATATKHNGEEASVQFTFSQRAGESATASLSFGLPSGMKLNRNLLPCFQGTVCNIGSAVAGSPLLPASALGAGTLTLTGALTGTSLYSPISGVSLTIGFPAPYPFQLVGPVSLSERVISYTSLPDIPLSALTFSFNGTSEGSAFVTHCQRSVMSATLTPQDGNPPVRLKTPVSIAGCPPRPTAAGKLSGLAHMHPRLRLRTSVSTDPADISAVSIALPHGLAFNRQAIGGACSAAGCRGIRGLQLAGARVAGASVHGTTLLLRFLHPTERAVLNATSPLLRESAAAGRHGHGPVRLRITDTRGTVTTVRIH